MVVPPSSANKERLKYGSVKFVGFLLKVKENKGIKVKKNIKKISA